MLEDTSVRYDNDEARDAEHSTDSNIQNTEDKVELEQLEYKDYNESSDDIQDDLLTLGFDDTHELSATLDESNDTDPVHTGPNESATEESDTIYEGTDEAAHQDLNVTSDDIGEIVRTDYDMIEGLPSTDTQKEFAEEGEILDIPREPNIVVGETRVVKLKSLGDQVRLGALL